MDVNLLFDSNTIGENICWSGNSLQDPCLENPMERGVWQAPPGLKELDMIEWLSMHAICLLTLIWIQILLLKTCSPTHYWSPQCLLISQWHFFTWGMQVRAVLSLVSTQSSIYNQAFIRERWSSVLITHLAFLQAVIFRMDLQLWSRDKLFLFLWFWRKKDRHRVPTNQTVRSR